MQTFIVVVNREGLTQIVNTLEGTPPENCVRLVRPENGVEIILQLAPIEEPAKLFLPGEDAVINVIDEYNNPVEDVGE